jgi:hypothetical protein
MCKNIFGKGWNLLPVFAAIHPLAAIGRGVGGYNANIYGCMIIQ